MEAQARANHDLEIETELTRYLVRQASTGFAIGIVAVAGMLLVLWRAGPPGVLLGWLVTIGVLTAPAFLVVRRFTRAADVASRIDAWQRALAVAYGLAGAGWGAAALLLYPRVAMPYQLFLLFILGGSAVSGMAALAPVRAAFALYLTATFVPMLAVLFAEGSRSSVATGLLLTVFGVATLSLAGRLRMLLVGSLRLRFENVDLIDDLSAAKDAAEAASRTKSLLLANMSHELRTPLTLILGPTRKLLAGAIDDETRRGLETVERNAQVLLKHLSDLLDVAKLESGRMELEPTDVDLGALVRRTVSLFEVVAHERGVALAIDAPETMPLVADAAKVERVLLNLLSNAMKFVPDGGHLWVALDAYGSEVVLSVEDDGPGVPVELREAIFEPFRRGDERTTRRAGGAGLGLAIVKDIVERHGGRIAVDASRAGGARFRVTLPFAPLGPARARAAAAGDRAALDEIARQTVAELRLRGEPAVQTTGDGTRGLVLVIEDNAEMSSFLVDCLAPDYRVATAFDGPSGLAQALALRPDLILSDVMMPGMAGDELLRALRARPELEAIPIIVLTAKADDALRVQLLHEGAQDFLTKPVIAEELAARVRNFVMLKRARDVLQHALSSTSRDVATLADRLAAANRAKDDFLAVLSHELRTPLTPILTWASLLLRERAVEPEIVERGLRAIERNAKLQARVVEDLLDISRVITGKLRLNVRPTAVDPVVHAAIESLRPAADAKGVCLDAVLEPEPAIVAGDADRLQQVAWNLVSNAIKFTPRGGRVEIRLAHVGNDVRLTVHDDGAGIDPAELPRLFDRFWQADSSITRAHGGLGLGLAVVRHLVELHGGAVHAESEGAGRGATFVVTLPALSVRHPAVDWPPRGGASGRDPRRLAGLKVLVVDDDRDTCEILGAVLEGAGAEVRTCLSANQALTAMDAWVPDILVSDIAMPGDDGYTLIRKVRARPSEEGGRMAAIALTAYGRSEDRVKALSAGFQVHVGKPIEPSQLVSVVESLNRPELRLGSGSDA